jgi:hypothetical protein
MIWKLDELEAILGVPRREIIDADKRSFHGLLSWTRATAIARTNSFCLTSSGHCGDD